MARVAACLLAIAAAESRGDVVNGSFETGDLSGWDLLGPAFGPGGSIAVRPPFGVTPPVPPTDGSYYAEILNNGSDTDALGLQQFVWGGVGDTFSVDYRVSSSGGGALAGITLGSQIIALVGSTAGAWFRASVPITSAGDQLFSADTASSGDSLVLFLDRVQIEPLSTAANPILPTTVSLGPPGQPPRFLFSGVPSGQWFDPPMAAGFAYEMLSESLFTGIHDFPTGFNQPFTVSVDGNVLGQFEPGQSVDFTSFPGGGVTSFQVTGLDPGADPESPNAFPLRLVFSTDQADFSMQAILEVPEPSGLALLAIGIGGIAGVSWRKINGSPRRAAA